MHRKQERSQEPKLTTSIRFLPSSTLHPLSFCFLAAPTSRRLDSRPPFAADLTGRPWPFSILVVV